MTNDEILDKAVEKAKKNGYDCLDFDEVEYIVWQEHIFDHDFCKAFFGEENSEFIICNDCDGNGWIGSPYTRVWDCKICKGTGTIKTGEANNEGWQYRLSKMVLEKNPLRYLEKFL